VALLEGDLEHYPRKFGKYHLLGPLAQGGMGALYLAVAGDRGLERLMVIKTVLPHLADAEYVARFRDEAKVVVKLSHGNLIPVFDAGLVGADGPTHAGSFDLTYLRCLPNMVVMAPSDENECRQMLHTGFQIDGPAAVRYPRGSGPGVPVQKDLTALPIGKGEVRRRGQRVAILSFGALLKPCVEAAEKLDATVANMRFVKPLDEELVRELAISHEWLVTVEENTILGGAGSAVLEALEKKGIQKKVLQLGLPDRFVDHGDPARLLKECGLDAEGIHASIAIKLAE